MLSALQAVELTVHHDEHGPASWIDGDEEFQPAPFYLWCSVPVPGLGWSWEWTWPAADLLQENEADDEEEEDTDPDDDDVAMVAVTDIAAWSALGRLDQEALWGARVDFDNEGPDPEDLFAVEDDDDATVALASELSFTVYARSVALEIMGGGDQFEILRDDAEESVVEILHELTGWQWDASDETAAVQAMVERAVARCRPVVEQHLSSAASALRLLDLLTASGALLLSADGAPPVLAMLKRWLLTNGDAARRARGLVRELLACAFVEEVFIDDDNLAAVLAAW